MIRSARTLTHTEKQDGQAEKQNQAGIGLVTGETTTQNETVSPSDAPLPG